VTILDLSGVSSYCDGFVICSANNRRQVRAVAEGIMEDLRSQGVRPLGVEGLDASRWVLIDLGDVLVHVFDEPMRGFYDLESMWSDARRVEPPAAVASPRA
jgi:ribosome-associated protein